ncbi:putative domain HDIG-containing protein [Halobacteroides halobius DSM 5150]|uniref:Putative domain HDIG-containing protein n=1 Tax=Halobacteroides halobius (strain ATCC 35273 / DSM 5150 / MD-1) TaxID=748449 RepID=L0KBV1_HALHC|nr:HD-GYP domain-containing protein [Halobacteroides halobius]AGB41834.1 putative domain HDIG-containing protein [Halobacteroides halobius DSM 5150]
MRLIKVENITANMKLAKPVYHQGRVLLNVYCSNLHKYKNKLLDIGIHHIYIEDEKSKNIEVNDIINRKTRIKSKKVIKKTMENISQNKKIEVNKINEAIQNIISDITNQETILVNLIDIKTTDDYTFEHSVNVAVLSILLGKSLNYNRKRLIKLGTGALLHDIGKVSIPEEILKKPDKLTDREYNIIKEHPKLGYENIKGYYNLSPLSQIAILSHHEKYDGSGYPHRLAKDDIHEFGKIVGIADVFDALTSDRCYRNRWPVHKAVDFLISKANEEFDPQLVNKFVKNIALYPNGISVKLSTGEKAIVKKQNQNCPTRPIVRVIEDKKGEELEEYKTLNLTETLNITIIDEEQK